MNGQVPPNIYSYIPQCLSSGENMIYLLAGRPIKNQSGCLECTSNGKATAVEEVGLINGHFHLVA